MIVRELIKTGEKACENAGVNSNFARFLMLEILRENNLDMYFVMDEVLDSKIEKDYLGKLKRICEDEPLAYVLGYHWFYGYKMTVNPNVLIPRQETEELVSYILNYAEDDFTQPKIVDVACGSGAIGIAVSKELDTPVVATDISADALTVAKQNAKDLEADMTFYQGDMLKPLIERGLKFDIIICNPPYIKETETIQRSVYDFEPHVALFGGADGLRFYRSVLEDASLVLNKTGLIAFEIGYDIGDAVKTLSETYFPHAIVTLLQDMNGLDRFVFVHQKKTKELEKSDIDQVSQLIQDGKIVAVPTDTVYGLAIRSDDARLYEQLKNVKNRPDDKPFPLMVASMKQLEALVELRDRDRLLIKKFMPGPVTFIFNKKKDAFSYLQHQSTLGVRLAEPWLQSVLEQAGVSVWLPSANKSNHPTGTTSDEVLGQLEGRIDGVVLGSSDKKASSSVFDLSQEEIRELRKGEISLETLLDYLENVR